jgi:CobQ-like glutamine amidotransferase family enzyme
MAKWGKATYHHGSALVAAKTSSLAGILVEKAFKHFGDRPDLIMMLLKSMRSQAKCYQTASKICSNGSCRDLPE